MKHLFVPEDIAKSLFEIKFNDPCLAIYFNGNFEIVTETMIRFFGYQHSLVLQNTDISSFINIYTAPLYQQVVDWFRLNHNLYLNIDHVNNPEPEMWGYDVCRIKGGGIIDMWDKTKSVKDYYENFNNAIKSAIQIIKR